MTHIESILSEARNLSRDDQILLVNKLMESFSHESAASYPKKVIAPRLDCPICHSSAHVVRNGHKHGKQAYICRQCGKSFVTTRNTLLSGSHSGTEIWTKVLEETLRGTSLDKTVKSLASHGCKISHSRLFFMRHKIMLALEDMQVEQPAMVEDVVEADETYVPESQKGTKFGPDASRKPRKRGTSASKRGLSSEQICICTAVQRKTGDLIVKSENRARPSSANVVDIYTGHVQKGTLFLTDGTNVYPRLGKILGITVMNVKKESAGFFNLNTVNNLHSFIKRRYIEYRGVATKYLNRYNLVFRAAYRQSTTVGELAEALFASRNPKKVHHYGDVKELNLLGI